jgi:hypothetical protein
VQLLAVDLERLLEHLVGHRRLRPERRERHELRAGVLAVEPRQHRRRPRLVHVVQEVHHRLGEHERLAGAQQLRVQPVRRVGEPDEHAAGEHERHLRRARVGVRRRHAAGGQVDARHGEALRVSAGEGRARVRQRHVEPEHRGAGVRCSGERRRGEVVGAGRRRVDAGQAVEVERLGSRRVGDAVVQEQVGVWLAKGGEEQNREEDSMGTIPCCYHGCSSISFALNFGGKRCKLGGSVTMFMCGHV